MICAIEDDVDLANVEPGAKYDLVELYTWCSVMHFLIVLNACLSTYFPDRWCLTIQHRCDCSCDDLQPVKRPSLIIMVGVYINSFWDLCLVLNKFLIARAVTVVRGPIFRCHPRWSELGSVLFFQPANGNLFCMNYIHLNLACLRRFYWIQSQYLAQMFPEKWHFFIHKIKIGVCTTSTSRRVVSNICTIIKWYGLKW